MVDNIKSLGVTIQHKLNFELHMSSLLKQCSQSLVVEAVAQPGLFANHLHTVFHAIVVSRILYALCARIWLQYVYRYRLLITMITV